MTHRTDRVAIPITEARCEPSKPCPVRGKCARYLASIPVGAPLADYCQSVYMGGTVLCVMFLEIKLVPAGSAAKARKAHPAPARGF